MKTGNMKPGKNHERLIRGFLVVLVVVLGASCKRTENRSARIADIPAQISVDNSTQLSNYEVVFDPIIEFQGEAFPVKILATAAMNTGWSGSPRIMNEGDYIGDTLGDFGASLTIKDSQTENIPVRLEIEGDRFIRKSVQDASVPPNTEIEIFPRITYDYSALEHLVQPAVENVTFRLYVNNNLMKEKLEVVRFHSVNEVPLEEISRWDNETTIDHTRFFAAYVNEDDPLIDNILREALEIGTVEKIGLKGSFSLGGYQDIDGDGDPSLEVYLQVMAVWSVFQRHNIKYSNITTTSTNNQRIATQYVRTLRESFENTQANCVDGTILFASVLRKLGIESFLVIIPGHMFLGYLLNEGEEISLGFLETTMLGNEDITKYTKDDSLLGKLKRWSGFGKTQSTVSRDSFIAASTVAEETWEAVGDKIFDDSEDDYKIILISEMRSVGIMPVKRY